MVEKALGPLRPLFDWPGVRWEKCKALYQLARRARGPVVELGTYHGCGAIALALGARDGHQVSVYTVDDYREKTGWAGEAYGPADRDIFERNIETAGVEIQLVVGDIRQVALDWTTPAGLIYWDIGGNRLYDDWLAWSGHLDNGGLFAVKDLPDWGFGYQKVRELALAWGWTDGPGYEAGCIWTLYCG